MKESTKVYFIDGYSPRKGLLGIITYPYDWVGKDIEYTMFLMTLNGKWGHQTLDFDTTSVVQRTEGNQRIWCLLGKRGQYAELHGEEFRVAQIVGAGTGKGHYGYLEKLSIVENDLYACGDSRQVYQLRRNEWTNIASEILAKSDSTEDGFESIDGSAADNIYAVGEHGQVFYYDGKKWSACEVPTNLHLHEVKCISEKEVLIVGERGVILHGAKNSWDLISDDRYPDDLWGVDVLNGTVYVTGFEGTFSVRTNSLSPVDFGVGRKVPGYRLRSKDGLLWAIGNDDIFCYDGANWTEIVCPENKEERPRKRKR